VPLFAVSIVPLLMIGVIALNVAPALAGPALWLADFILANLLSILEGMNRWTLIPVALDLPRVSGFAAGTCIIIAAVLIWPRPLPARMRVVMLLLPMLAFGVTRHEVPALRVIIMDVGQGLAILLQTPGYAVLFDTGPRYRHGDAGRSIVIPVMRHFGVMQLDHLIVSHGDADHVGGARSVLGSYPDTGFLAPERLELPAEHFQLCRAGQNWQRDGVSFRILHPGLEAESGSWSENDASCVLLVQSAHVSLLLPGDIERRAERRLVASGTLPAVDLVIAPHHGSRTSSTPAFVAATRPDFVVFSVGHRNQWHFPAPEVRERWSAGEACTLTTSDSGALVFEAHGEGPLRLVKRYRDDQARIWTEAGSAGLLERRCRPQGATN
jgi:competence protein ComEC